MKRYSFLLILLTFILVSCEKDINLKLPEPSSKLAVHALWNKDSILEVTVTRSFNISETPRLGPNEWPEPSVMLKKYAVPNAKVIVYQNEMPYDELAYVESALKYKSKTGKRSEADARYSVKVEVPGFEAAASPVAAFPAKVLIQSMEVRHDVARDEFGNRLSEVTLTFNDPAHTKNYYWLYFDRKHRTMPETYLASDFFVFPIDKDVIVPVGDVIGAVVDVKHDRVIFKDDNFNGQTKRITLRIPYWVIEETRAGGALETSIHLRNISEDVFKYVRSKVIDTDNPFSSPVQAHSNIAGGLGIFGLFAGDSRLLK